MSGHKRLYADMVAAGEILDHDSAKKPVPRLGQYLLCKLARCAKNSVWVFLFVAGLWEHLSRSGSMSELSYLFMGQSGDHIWTSFNTDKTHKEGEDSGNSVRIVFTRFVEMLVCAHRI
jgi:hypothetical protein